MIYNTSERFILCFSFKLKAISFILTQTFLIGRGDVAFLHIAYVKSTKNVGKLTYAIQEPVFPVANTDFEGGYDDHGYGDYIFLVIYTQPSHTKKAAMPRPC
jgi:hypothetical protein